MVTGSIQKKKGYLYIVLNLKDEDGERKQKWISTHLKENGNKKRAEEMLQEYCMKYSTIETIKNNSRNIYFHDYMMAWVNTMKGKVTPTTYNSYKYQVHGSIFPFFKEHPVLLNQLKPYHINDYYDYLMNNGLSANTAIHHHANIRKALQEALYRELIPFNPADRAQRPKKDEFVTNPYSVQEANRLLELIQGEKLELIIILALFYGLRRSEVLGLRWSAIDFENNTISINHSISSIDKDGKYAVMPQNKLKKKSSFRTLPLIKSVKDRLVDEFNKREQTMQTQKNDYICIDEQGKIIKPTYVSHGFNSLLKKYDLRPIRFHDLRHSCANLLVSAQVPLIEVQQWLGHSNISTTADLYSHLDFSTKQRSAEIIKKN